MAVGLIVQAAMSLIGGMVTGAVTANATDKANRARIQEYGIATNTVRDATNKYSGSAGYQSMVNAGYDRANDLMNRTGQVSQTANTKFQPQNVGQTNSQYASALRGAQNVSNDIHGAFGNGMDEGMSQRASLNNAYYNADTVRAQQAMKQADIDYNVANQQIQGSLQAVGNIANTAGQIGNPWKPSWKNQQNQGL